MSITVWAAPASRLQSRYVLRFLKESRLPIRAVEVRLFMYNRTPMSPAVSHCRRYISRYPRLPSPGHPPIIRDEAEKPPS